VQYMPTERLIDRPSERPTSMVGESDVLRHARALLQRYARCDAPVLIEGETGTGKELAAREIHYASGRRLGPFVPINCGALPEALLESELFGHRRGAFTDAKNDEPGLIEYARGGTLFLDEVDSLPSRAQTTLLRFLQDGEFRAVGARNLRTADVRVLAATNASLEAVVENGQFRRDLLYRLNALRVSLPALRERGDDIALLARHLLEAVGARLEQSPRRWTPEALAALCAYDWPGNVRELENVILRICMRSDGETIGTVELMQAEPALIRCETAKRGIARAGFGVAHEELAENIARDSVPAESDLTSKKDLEYPERAHVGNAEDGGDADDDRDDVGENSRLSAFALAKRRVIAAFERRYLTELMRRTGGNVSHAAALSGTERRQLGKMLKRYGIGRSPVGDA
jgi:DNA-binding NtrC family response regulator